MRQLVLLILFVLVGRWLTKARRAPGTEGARGTARGARSAQAHSLAEPVVRCAACGVHAPKTESIVVVDQYFCCAEHARRYMARATAPR